LRDVSLTVAPGRSLGVIGTNGSGKTTLLQVLAGVLRPTRGEVTVRGRVASLVDLSAGFHRDLTGRENVLVGGVLLGMSRAEVRARYDEIVAFSGLPADALDAPLSAYSAGMGLRLGFALVVHTDPDVLLVDEVLAVGDDHFRAQSLARVDELRAAGTALVLVSHDLGLVRARCDEVAVLERGELARVGSPEESVAYYRDRQGVTAEVDAASARLFDESHRARSARKRRGV
jgi:lipopolysaccharide transport system ATP-binding protein